MPVIKIFLVYLNSKPGRFHAAPFLRHDSCAMDHPSPRILHENHAIPPQQGGYSYQSNWAPSGGHTEMLEIGVGKTDACEKNLLIDHPQGEIYGYCWLSSPHPNHHHPHIHIITDEYCLVLEIVFS